MKNIFLVYSFSLFSNFLNAQQVKDGVYFFKIKDLEYHGMIVGKCKAIVKGNFIKLIYLSGTLSLMKVGDVYDEGLLLRHKKTNQWIIGKNKKDANVKEITPCENGGPRPIDFKKKIIEQC